MSIVMVATIETHTYALNDEIRSIFFEPAGTSSLEGVVHKATYCTSGVLCERVALYPA